MRITINHFTRVLLLIVLRPFVIVIRLFRFLTGKKRPQYLNTLTGDPLLYSGPRPVVISLWATWASVWKVCTEKIVLEAQKQFGDRCEFAFIEIVARRDSERYDAGVLPAVIVRHNGQEIVRFVNMVEADEFMELLKRLCAA